MGGPISPDRAKVLWFVLGYVSEHRLMPTREEIGAHIGKSPNAAHEYLRRLIRDGEIGAMQIMALMLGGVCAASHINFPKYVISEAGDIFSFVHIRPHKLKTVQSGKYRMAMLADASGAIRSIRVHRLVAETFHGAGPAGQEVRHLDGDSIRNCASNLAWGTKQENQEDKVRHGTVLRGEQCAQSRMTEKQILEIRRLAAENILTSREIKEQFDLTTPHYYKIIRRRRWAHI